MKYICVVFIGAVIIFGSSVYAKSYTKEEIKTMISKRKYPKLGMPEISERTASMEICAKLASEQRVGFANEGWPTKIVKETDSVVIVEIWGSDAKTTFKCENDHSIVKIENYKI